jgi:hypothetical protein
MNLTNQQDIYVFDCNNINFPNCMENTILNFIRLLHYNHQTNLFVKGEYNDQFDILQDSVSFSNIERFSRYLNTKFTNINHIEYVNERYFGINKIKYELETSLLNFVIIIIELLHLKIEYTDDIEIKTLKGMFIEKINEKFNCEISIPYYVHKNDGEYTYITIKNKNLENITYSITLQKYIHAEMNIEYE